MGFGQGRAPLSADRPDDRAELAFRWAPVHHQDVDQTGTGGLGGVSDYLTRVDFDGDWMGANNWESLANPTPDLRAVMYYSVVETSTHWFILYMAFHPRDWDDWFFDTEHENDAEGVLLAVERNGEPFGALRAAVTVAHRDFYSFVPAGSPWRSGQETVDGELRLDGGRAVTAQEAKGHGLKAWPEYDIRGDGIVYRPVQGSVSAPSGPDDRGAEYGLVDIFEIDGLWDRRDDPQLFVGSSFVGDRGGGCGRGTLGCTANAASAPWGWDDGDDGVPRGALAVEPAVLVSTYFAVPEAVSVSYTFNPYLLP